jgi:hypothetical protein
MIAQDFIWDIPDSNPGLAPMMDAEHTSEAQINF